MSWYLIVWESEIGGPYEFIEYKGDFQDLIFFLRPHPYGFPKNAYIFDNKKPVFIHYMRGRRLEPPQYVPGAVACKWHCIREVLSVFDPEKGIEHRFKFEYAKKRIYFTPWNIVRDRQYLREVRHICKGFYSTRLRDIYNGKDLLKTIRALSCKYSKVPLQK